MYFMPCNLTAVRAPRPCPRGRSQFSPLILGALALLAWPALAAAADATRLGGGKFESGRPKPPVVDAITGACCFHNAAGVPQCVFTTNFECASDYKGVFGGQGSSCDPFPCPTGNSGACCYSPPGGGLTCAIFYQGECANWGGTFFGIGSSCNPSPCVPPDMGACCFVGPAGPTCVVLLPIECEFVQGQYQGNGVPCTPDPCQAQTGACCHMGPAGPMCSVVSPIECEMLQGQYQGNGTLCTPDPCQNQTGACCYQAGTPVPQCAVMTAIECEQLQGQYQGNGTVCNPNPCPILGRCCYLIPGTTNWQCVVATVADCDAIYNGQWGGPATTCNPPQVCGPIEPTGACCYVNPLTGAVQCIVTTPYECEATYHGLYQGDNTSCSPVNPCTETGACCYGGEPGQPQGCVVTTPADCVNTYNGTFQGFGVPCGPNNTCPTADLPGACCYGFPAQCIVVPATECYNVYFGVWMGAQSTCTPNPCLGPGEGACCVHDNSGNSLCVQATQVQCTEQLQGTFFGVGTTCTPEYCPGQTPTCKCPGNCDNRTPRFEDPAFAGFTGEVAVCTRYDPFITQRSLVVVDLKNKAFAPFNTNWFGGTLYSHPSWAETNLGTVFGVTVDRNGNIYTTASTSYWTQLTGLGGWGTVYKIDAVTALPSVFANLPNNGPGLGNIAYDAANNQLFVTNFEDGRIYRLNMAGACLSTFNHASNTVGTCAPDPNDPGGFAPLGQRPWGIAVWNNRVYYGLWVEDGGRPDSTAANQVWSIALSGGNFSGGPQLEISLPALTIGSWTADYSNPPSDISFSSNGCMLVSERSMYGDMGAGAHASRVLKYALVGSSWWLTPTFIGLGCMAGGANSSGGADFHEDSGIWGTADALQFSPQVIYGLQGLPCNGGTVNNSILVDLNGNLSFADKTLLGDVDVTCVERCAPPPRRMVAWFPLDETSGATALDLAWANNGAYTGTTAIAGKVAGAHRFNGTGDFIRVPNAGQLNFGTGNFSFDAWVRTTDNVGVKVLIDKRDNPVQGYSFYLFNGRPGMQIADGGSFINYAPLVSVADGQWHHIAVTVDRTSATGIKFYVDGAFVAAFSPLGQPGSVSTSKPLWIGVREPALGGGGHFLGDLDEIELFNTELSPQAVQRLYAAGAKGKCKERAFLPAVTSFCWRDSAKIVPFTIFNDSGNGYNYTWSMQANANCSVPWSGSSWFAPSNSGAFIGPLGSQTWNVNITKPAGLGTACYDATVVNTNTGNQFGASSMLTAAPWKWCFIIVGPIDVSHVIDFPVGTARVARFGLTNTDTVPQSLHYAIVAESSDGDLTNQVVSLNGLPPGEPVIDFVSAQPGETKTVEVSARLLEHQPFNIHHLVLMVDAEGTGEYTPVAAVGLQSTPGRCRGDTNCDGVVTFDDIDPFVEALQGQAAWPYPDCPWLNADCDGDGDVDFDDIDSFVSLIGTVCP